MKKRLSSSIALLLSLLMLLAFLPALANAEENNVTVKEYICAPSQYTNVAIGSNIEKTLDANGATVSLGNFGGYVTYEFATPVKNSSTNPYGVDFKLVGNAFNASYTTQEPGQVWVSQDGNNWYALAGSEHYEDGVIWDYRLTYINNGTKVLDYADNMGNEGTTKGAYPLAEKYPTVTFNDEAITFDGVLLASQRTASTANGISTSFGYVDALKKDITDSVANPYIENPAQNGMDGMFDISWAVDENGYPVKLDWVKYVKVQTATFIDGGAFGEKSTEISKLILLNENTVNVGKTDIESISINGNEVALTENKVIYDVSDFTVDGQNTVSVVSADANIYINNAYGSEKTFEGTPEKGIIRVIAQKGESEPTVIYLKTLNGTGTPDEPTEPDSNIEHIVGNGATVSFSAFDGSVIVPNGEISVSDGIAEEYGYKVAKKDHNGNRIDGATVMDLLVTVHKAYYGDSFTKETANNYLVMNSGFITKAFGKSASASGFTVNDILPGDGIYNPLYDAYTGYACDTAKLVSGDEVVYFFYQDTESWYDFKAVFSEDTISATVGEPVSVNVNAYCLWYGLSTPEVREANTVPAYGVDIYLSDGTKLASTDINGTATLTFDTAGEYTIYVSGEVISEEAPVVIDWASVTVNEAPIDEPTEPEAPKEPDDDKDNLNWFQKIIKAIKAFFEKIVNFFKGLKK